MSVVVEVVTAALRDRPAWIVGGAVRDELLGRPVDDVDVALDGDVRAAAAAVAQAAGPGAARFELSGPFRTWRVVGPEHAWQVDISALRGDAIDADLRLRDLTINAMARSVAGGEILDPTGGLTDLDARVARVVSEQALVDDPLRALRVARFACELELTVDAETARLTAAHAAGLDRVAGERLFAELKRIVAAPRIRAGLALMDELGLTVHALPELAALAGVEQNRYHHADVLGHTLEVLDEVLAMEADPAQTFGPERADEVRALLGEPLADGLTRAHALRLGALLHDAAKPQTRAVSPEGETLGFPRHDVEGAELVRVLFGRLRTSEALRAHVAALTRHHLRLGFLVHERDELGVLPRREVYRYLVATDPVEVDVTLLSTADRLATRGRKADESIAKHVGLARQMLAEALDWRAGRTRPQPLLRGDELARELDIAPGPLVGELLAELAEARFAGAIGDRQEALDAARALLAERV
jgi:tRNA nucleotidyltransferase/poly(A) polymerase